MINMKVGSYSPIDVMDILPQIAQLHTHRKKGGHSSQHTTDQASNSGPDYRRQQIHSMKNPIYSLTDHLSDILERVLITTQRPTDSGSRRKPLTYL